MNLYPWRLFVSRDGRGRAWQLVEIFKSSPIFRGARFDVYLPAKDASRLVVCFGQMHTVLNSRGVWWWTARQIARTQARLFTYYHFFLCSLGVMSFGEEGMTHDLGGEHDLAHFHFHNESLPPELISKLAVGELTVAREWLSDAAKRWLDLLRSSRVVTPALAEAAARVSGARLFGAAERRACFYPIEGETAYGHVRRGIDMLERELKRVEMSAPFRDAKAKGFKKLTQTEYDAVHEFNRFATTFQKTLASDFRERACFAIALKKIETEPIVAFTMGVAHRFHFRRLAPEYLHEPNVGFVFITPPELWWWGFITKMVIWLAAFVCVAYVVWRVA